MFRFLSRHHRITRLTVFSFLDITIKNRSFSLFQIYKKGCGNTTDLPQRKRIRLKEYDYSTEGYYFITICTEDRKRVLSEIIFDSEGKVTVLLKPYGQIAESFIKTIPGIDKYVIMPNHIHMIIHKTNGKSVSSDLRSFKLLVTKKLGASI